MKATFLKGVALGSVVSLVTLSASAAVAGTGVGAIFNLGRTNSVDATTLLTGSTNGKQLQITNSSTRRGAVGLGIKVAAGRPPLAVSNPTKIDHLNADLLDGVHASGFVRTSHIMHGAIDTTASGGTRLFLDPVTGAAVKHYGIGEVEITNTNAKAHLLIHGFSRLNAQEDYYDLEVSPGQTVPFPNQTIDPQYLDLMVMKLNTDPSKAASMHLTCAVGENSSTRQDALDCLGVT